MQNDKIFLLLLLSYFLFLPSSGLFACEPCAKGFSFEESLQAADLVIIGEKVGEGPHSNFGQEPGGPDWIEVVVKAPIIGDPSSDVIKINSWDAMCEYGIILQDNRPHILILKKKTSLEENYTYDAVYNGCGVKSYPIKDENVLMNDEEIPWETVLQKIVDVGDCFDLHGGYKCHPAKNKINTKNQNIEKDFWDQMKTMIGCRTDVDCHAINNGECATSGILTALLTTQGQTNPAQHRCRCLTGPVEYGCVPE